MTMTMPIIRMHVWGKKCRTLLTYDFWMLHRMDCGWLAIVVMVYLWSDRTNRWVACHNHPSFAAVFLVHADLAAGYDYKPWPLSHYCNNTVQPNSIDLTLFYCCCCSCKNVCGQIRADKWAALLYLAHWQFTSVHSIRSCIVDSRFFFYVFIFRYAICNAIWNGIRMVKWSCWKWKFYYFLHLMLSMLSPKTYVLFNAAMNDTIFISLMHYKINPEYDWNWNTNWEFLWCLWFNRQIKR